MLGEDGRLLGIVTDTSLSNAVTRGAPDLRDLLGAVGRDRAVVPGQRECRVRHIDRHDPGTDCDGDEDGR